MARAHQHRIAEKYHYACHQPGCNHISGSCLKPGIYNIRTAHRNYFSRRNKPAVPVSSLEGIEGFWHVSRFEDYEPGWQDYSGWRNASVHIDNGQLTYSVGCNRSGNPTRIEGRVLKHTGDGDRMQTCMGCGEV